MSYDNINRKPLIQRNINSDCETKKMREIFFVVTVILLVVIVVKVKSDNRLPSPSSRI